ncbi:hypothetical protein RJZ56_001407 [Blastomyces dermatitidis]
MSIGKKESEWTKIYGKPSPVRFPPVNFDGINSLNDHLRLLSQYKALAPYLLGDDSHNELSRPTLRHPDWQHAALLPLLLATGHPPMLQSPDNPPPKTLEKPVLPDNYHSLSPEEKSYVDELYRRRVLFYLYMVFNGGLNKQHLAGMRDPCVLLTQHLVERMEKQWSGDIFSLKGALIHITENWDHYNAELPNHMNGLVEYWKSELQGMSDDGWVRTEAFEDAIKKNMELMQVLLDGSDTPEEERCVQEQWPFQDHEEEAN